VIGTYIIQSLTITLYAMKVSSTAVNAYKAIVIIIFVILGSSVVQKYALQLRDRLLKKKMKITKNN
jgi:galactofuranose transport system permease protein